MASITSLAMGSANLFVSFVIFVLAFIGAIVAFISLVKDDHNGWEGLVFAILLALLIVSIVFLTFLVAGSGVQVAGAYLSLKGRRFGQSVTMLIVGAVATSIAASISVIASLSIPLLIAVGGYLFLSTLVSIGCTVAVVLSRDSFSDDHDREKGDRPRHDGRLRASSRRSSR